MNRKVVTNSGMWFKSYANDSLTQEVQYLMMESRYDLIGVLCILEKYMMLQSRYSLKMDKIGKYSTASYLKLDVKIFESYLCELIEYGFLFYNEKGDLCSYNIEEQMEPMRMKKDAEKEKKQKARSKKKVEKTENANVGKQCVQNDNHCETKENHDVSPYIKEKNRIEKKRKEEKREEKEKEKSEDSVVQNIHLKKDVSLFYENIEFLGMSPKNEEKVFKCFLNWLLEQGIDIHQGKTIAQFEMLLNQFLNAHMMFFKKLKASEIMGNPFVPPYDTGVLTSNDFVSASGVL